MGTRCVQTKKSPHHVLLMVSRAAQLNRYAILFLVAHRADEKRSSRVPVGQICESQFQIKNRGLVEPFFGVGS